VRTSSGRAGINVQRFTGRWRGRRLRRGRHRLVLQAVDAAGNVSARRGVRFTVAGR
jgi:hypothetical protein